ncbi:hypothetical protein MN202_19630 [Rheinheimera muenzenbergensis]|uniref:Lipoprotein n=1 Tax=Rheinheimera muenzenbergensis TaxID=1193628 RepID=A0ABU8CBT2_9GAMM
MKMLKFVPVLLVVLTGCGAVSPQRELHKLNTAPTCCQSFNEVVFQVSALGESQQIRLERQPVFPFEQGKSYYIALQRPEKAEFIEVVSWINGSFIPSATLVYPVVTVLDEQKAKLTTLRPKEYWRNGLSIKPHPVSVPYYSVRFRLPDAARYVLIHTTPDMVKEFTPYTHHAPNGKTLDVNMRFSVGGLLDAQFQ